MSVSQTNGESVGEATHPRMDYGSTLFGCVVQTHSLKSSTGRYVHSDFGCDISNLFEKIPIYLSFLSEIDEIDYLNGPTLDCKYMENPIIVSMISNHSNMIENTHRKFVHKH